MNHIVLVIEGGVLQDVIGLPEGYEYALVDHDIKEGEPGHLTSDEIDKLVALAGTPLQQAARNETLAKQKCEYHKGRSEGADCNNLPQGVFRSVCGPCKARQSA